MIFNLILGVLFAGSAGYVWYLISARIPELIAIPDEVIVERLHEDSARVRIFLLHAKTFWREPRYHHAFWRFCEKIIQRAHIALMRADNGVVTLLKKVRSSADTANRNGIGEHLLTVEETVVEEKKEVMPMIVVASLDAAAPPTAPRAALSRMQEVRPKKGKERIIVS